MGISSGPKLIRDNLVLHLDARNKRSYRENKSIINWDSWTVGVGSVTGYAINGDGNSRIIDTNPWGDLDIVWDTSNNDVESNADGGWNGTAFTPDRTKMYRFSTFIRRKVRGNGSAYLGPSGTVLTRSAGTATSNPYFNAFSWPASVAEGEWLLFTGHVWPEGSGTGDAHVDSAVYRMDGTKLFATGDFVFNSTMTSMGHRSYLYYSTMPETTQQWYQPRIDICDGTEPSIADLLNNIGNRWNDISGNNNHCYINGLAKLTQNMVTLDGIKHSIRVPDNDFDFSACQTIMVVTKHTNTTGQRPIWSQAAGGYGSIVHNNGATFDYQFGDAGDSSVAGVTTASDTTPTGKWNCVCSVRTTEAHRWYKNGVMTSTTPHSLGVLTQTTTGVTIGTDQTSYWGGDIALILAYTRALTDAEVKQNYEAIKHQYDLY